MPPSLSTSLARRLVRQSSVIGRSVAYLVALLVAGPLVYHLARGSQAYLGLLEDDYFYYSIIADNLVGLGRLTYDSATLTNGFHPLWFLVLLLLRLIAGGLNGPFYALLTVLLFASMVVTYELSRRFARSLGASAALAPVVALIHCVASDVVLASGMETAVDVPLLLWLFIEVARGESVTPRRGAKLGLIASLAILARLDIAIVVPLLFAGWVAFARPTLSRLWRVTLAFCAAGLALPAYAAFNWFAFGSVLPMSALAKQLVKRPGVNVRYLIGVAFRTQYGLTAGVSLALGAAAACLLWRRRAETAVRPAALFAGALAILFAAVFYLVNTLNGWIYFGWYSYPLGPALVAALTLFGTMASERVAVPLRARATGLLVAGAAAIASVEGVAYFATHGPLWSIEDNGLLAMSVELAERLHGRTGVYGMGAIGGFATYELKEPVVQLEGLVSDRAMIDHIRREDDLGAVLKEYHVDYLVISLQNDRMVKRDGCYALTQPNAEWAGRRVAKMRGDLCAEPIVYFPTRLPHHSWSVFSSLDTYVFDLRGAKWRSRQGG